MSWNELAQRIAGLEMKNKPVEVVRVKKRKGFAIIMYMGCPVCGRQAKRKNLYCPGCGQRLKWSKSK